MNQQLNLEENINRHKAIQINNTESPTFTNQEDNQQERHVISKAAQIHDHRSEVSQEQIPQHFYDSDMASVCEKDFMSDNEPPKDIIQERKLLFKEKLLHVFKTIIRVGTGIDKPARYDKIKINHREVPKQDVKKKIKEEKSKKIKKNALQNHSAQNKQANQKDQNVPKQNCTSIQIKQQNDKAQELPPFYSTSYLQESPVVQYNLGHEREEIQRLICSMKRGETALFELQHLIVSKNSNIKIKSKTEIHVIHVFDWTTVIDLDGDRKLLKYVLRKGQGAFRVALFDKISFKYEISKQNEILRQESYSGRRLQQEFIQKQLPKVVWRVMTSMKDQQSVQLEISNQDLREFQGEQFYSSLQKQYSQSHQTTEVAASQYWGLKLEISKLIKVDDVHLDGRLLKQTIVRGVSTAKPQSSSLVYYALKFIDNQQKQLKVDECFGSDWWQDLEMLNQLQGIRKNHLDDYSISKMLRKAIKRMKPAEIALVECRDNQLFQYGSDFQEMKNLLKFDEVPDVVKIIVRVYNFTEARTAFSMELDEKIIESRRKKQVAIRLLSQNKIQKALKRFESIVAFYSSEKINQEAYDQKVSALMNAILCYMKLKKFPDMINLCNQILLKPRHGHLTKDIKIVGPGHAKIEGSLPKNQGKQQNLEISDLKGDSRRIATDLVQNQNIIDKCLYRKAFALVQMGQCSEALKCIGLISEGMSSTEQVEKLKKEASAGKAKYQQKSKKIFKSMFG